MRCLVFKLIICSISFLGLANADSAALSGKNDSSPSFYLLKAKTLDGKDFSFESLKGKVVLIVNTASQCGFTPQLAGLEQLYKTYHSKGLEILAFPSNDFKQEPNESSAIQSFAEKKYSTSFPFFEKAAVTGREIQPVYAFLTQQKSGLIFSQVSWNFEKFLVNKKGEVIERWNSMKDPLSSDVKTKIEKALLD